LGYRVAATKLDRAVCSTHDAFLVPNRSWPGRIVAVGNAPKRPASLVGERPSGELIERLFNLSVDMLGAASFDGYLILLNPAWERVLGWSISALMAQPYVSFLHPDDVEAARARMVHLKGSHLPVLGYKSRFRKSDGQYLTLEWNAIVDDRSVYFVGHDITANMAIEGERDQTARVMEAVIENVDDGIYVADSTGHMTLINPAALELLGYESPNELRNRIPHLTFHYNHPDGAAFPIDECDLTKVPLTGIPLHVDEDAFWRKDGTMIPVSYSSAPIELSDGTGSVVAFHDITAFQAERDRQRAQVDEIEWFDEIKKALTEDRFVLYAQPVISLATGSTFKHELLLRMLTSDGEVIEPAQFLPVAEKFGLISDIDEWVITHGFDIAATGGRIAINLSAPSMVRLDILLHIERELARTGVPPGDITFELTETAVMQDLEEGRRFAERLVALGCSFALDDFGTGYASLTYLRELPITYVKIDGRFVNKITQNESDSSMVEAIVQMARTLGKTTIAEGIEDEDTLSKLRGFGVDLGQGYYIGRPGPLA
jgi:PAS domain S-box-containing protein